MASVLIAVVVFIPIPSEKFYSEIDALTKIQNTIAPVAVFIATAYGKKDANLANGLPI